ncbi:Superoxide dismutase [Cu-Zn] [Hypsizygus marmoreus]|uniref:Superoxide dismutase [Cu-Zn] n=1 Tax=Hypsizygus marmoreus TaxID=39966 RepID=A0A369JBU6_HYPMA|nr:Superoxide dismutase [Cu-Zn] [Hypsizygus marmoreus]
MDSFSDNKSTKAPRSRVDNLVRAAFVILGVFVGFSLLSWWKGDSPPPPALITKAVVVLSGSSNVTGIVTFYQSEFRGPVTVRGELKNLDSNALRGFHVHHAGDLTNGCLSAGAHYNPFGKTHGAPTDKARHVGDLGNIQTNGAGEATFTIKDSQLSLNGPLSILGRAIVVHAGTDDLGKGGNEESLKTGNAGGRAACGVIGISS